MSLGHRRRLEEWQGQRTRGAHQPTQTASAHLRATRKCYRVTFPVAGRMDEPSGWPRACSVGEHVQKEPWKPTRLTSSYPHSHVFTMATLASLSHPFPPPCQRQETVLEVLKCDHLLRTQMTEAKLSQRQSHLSDEPASDSQGSPPHLTACGTQDREAVPAPHHGLFWERIKWRQPSQGTCCSITVSLEACLQCKAART